MQAASTSIQTGTDANIQTIEALGNALQNDNALGPLWRQFVISAANYRAVCSTNLVRSMANGYRLTSASIRELLDETRVRKQAMALEGFANARTALENGLRNEGARLGINICFDLAAATEDDICRLYLNPSPANE